MTSIKIKTNWETDNIISDGVRIYKKTESFNIDNLPLPLVELTDGSAFYEDLDVVEDQIYFYMLSSFLGEQEVFTECYEVKTINETLTFQSPFPTSFDTYPDQKTGTFTLSKNPSTSIIDNWINDLKVLGNTAFINPSVGEKYYYEVIVKSETDKDLNPVSIPSSMLRIGIGIQGLHTGINSRASSSGVYFSADGYGKCWMRRIDETSYEFRGGDLTTFGSEVVSSVQKTFTFGDVIGVLAYRSTPTQLTIEYYVNGVHIRTVSYAIASNRGFKPLIIYRLTDSKNANIVMVAPKKLLFKPTNALEWAVV